MDTAPLIFRRDATSAKGQWPISKRARWLPALAIAIGIIYRADVSGTDLPSGGDRRPPSSANARSRLDGGDIQRDFDGSDEIRFTKRLPDDHGAWPEGLNHPRVSTDEQMRHRSRAEDLFDSRNTASSHQSRVDDHQVRRVSGGRRYRVGLSGRCGADIVTHSCEQFRKQHGDQGVVLNDENPKRFHRSICARPQLDRHYYSCSSCSVADCSDRRVDKVGDRVLFGSGRAARSSSTARR